METARLGLAASQLHAGPASARCFPFPSFFTMADKLSPPKPGGRCMQSSPLTWGLCMTHPPEKVDAQEDPERWLLSSLPLSLIRALLLL